MNAVERLRARKDMASHQIDFISIGAEVLNLPPRGGDVRATIEANRLHQQVAHDTFMAEIEMAKIAALHDIVTSLEEIADRIKDIEGAS
jgi:hypothetical protein